MTEDNILHDFSNEKLKVSIYDGAAEKRTMYYQGHRYMLKFGYLLDSSKRETSRTSYINTPVNEFIGSRIFKTAGFPTQDVLLGMYQGQSVVACRDFMEELDPSWKLIHFKQLEISMPGGSGRSKARPDWEYVKRVLDDSQDIESIRSETKQRFCQMICVDALIGNYDRHSNNWGFIADGQANIRGLAPVYDCGSSLMPHLSHDEMLNRLRDPKLMRQANMDSPTLAMNVHGKRRKYSFFMTSEYASEFRRELPSIWDRISEERINRVIDETPGLDNLHKDFYKATLDARRRYVLAPALEMTLNERSLSVPTAEDKPSLSEPAIRSGGYSDDAHILPNPNPNPDVDPGGAVHLIDSDFGIS